MWFYDVSAQCSRNRSLKRLNDGGNPCPCLRSSALLPGVVMCHNWAFRNLELIGEQPTIELFWTRHETRQGELHRYKAKSRVIKNVFVNLNSNIS